MKLAIKAVLPMVTTTTLLMASCRNAIPEVKDEQQDYSLEQAELDSAAYREIFNSTVAAKDSDKVAKFNELAADMKCTFNELDRIITDEGISKEEYNMGDFHLAEDCDTCRVYQHFIDSWMYKNLFKKLGIFSDSIARKCDEAAEKTKPFQSM